MKKTISAIITATDIAAINDFIRETQAIPDYDEEVILLKAVIASIKDYPIVNQFVIYTWFTIGDKSVTKTADHLNVSPQCISLYIKDFKEKTQAQFRNEYADYQQWLQG